MDSERGLKVESDVTLMFLLIILIAIVFAIEIGIFIYDFKNTKK